MTLHLRHGNNNFCRGRWQITDRALGLHPHPHSHPHPPINQTICRIWVTEYLALRHFPGPWFQISVWMESSSGTAWLS